MLVYEAAAPVGVEFTEVYRIHQQACQLVPHLVEVDGIQGFQYAAHAAGNQTYLLFRSKAPLGLPGQVEKHYSFVEGEKVTFSCRLSISMIDKLTRKTCYFKGQRLKQYINEKIRRAGVCTTDLVYSAIQMSEVKKKGHSFRIPWCDIVFTGKVISPESLENAFQAGLGGKRAFGFGLMIQRKEPTHVVI